MTDEQLQRLAALAEAATPARWIAEQGMGVRLADYTPICMSSVTGEPVNVDANMAFIAAARQAVPELLAEAADLRRQLAEERMRANAAEFAVAQLLADAADLRRQVAEAQAAIAAVPQEEIDDLYTAYAYAVAGWDEGKAREFPQVGRWLGILPGADDNNTPPHRAGKGDAR